MFVNCVPQLGCVDSSRTVCNVKNHSSNEGKLKQQFTFTRVFGPEENQSSFFRGSTLNTVSQFVNGENCLVFAYGTTNSGKTYTVQGSASNPGVIPHAVDVIFNSIGSKLDAGLNLQPLNMSDVQQITSKQMSEIVSTKTSLIDGVGEFYTSFPSESSAILFDSTLKDGTIHEVSISQHETCRFQVWVSFAEIYNENIFDLFDSNPEKRKRLRLTVDKSGNNFIKGLKLLPVNSAKETRQFLSLGRRNLHISSTKLNQSSSRSHCIFTIYLVRVVDTPDPHQAMVNSLVFCDLAGSERVEKTQNTGERLKEAGKINNSLMVFGRCIEALKTAQNAKDHVLIPFRDSKLTQLFQFFFVGKGRASMIVNVSPAANMFDDTLNVLKVSAVAKQVVSDQLEKTFLNITSVSQRLTDLWIKSGQRWSSISRGRVMQPKQSIMTVKEDSIITEEDEETENDEVVDEDDDDYGNIQELIDLVKFLESKYNSLLQEKQSLEINLRQQFSKEFQARMDNQAKFYEEQIAEMKESEEKFTEKRLEITREALSHNFCRKSSVSQSESSDEEKDKTEVVSVAINTSELSQVKNENDFLEQIETLTNKLNESEDRVKKLESQNAHFSKELENKSKTIQSLHSNLESKVIVMTQLLEKKEEEIQNLNTKLVNALEARALSCSNLTKQLEEKDLEIKCLRSEQTKTCDCERKAVEIECKEKEIKDLQEIITNLQSSLLEEKNLSEQTSSENSSYKSQVSALQEEVSVLRAKQSEAELSLQEEKKHSEQNISGLQTRYKNVLDLVERKLQNLFSKFLGKAVKVEIGSETDFEEKVEMLEEDLLKLKVLLKNAEDKRKSAVQDVEKLGDILLEKNSEIHGLGLKIESLESELANREGLQKQHVDQKQFEALLKNKVSEIELLQAEIATLKNTAAEKDSEIRGLTSKIKSLEKKSASMVALQEQHDEVLSTQKQTAEIIDKKDSEIALLQAQISTLQNTASEKDCEIRGLTLKVESLQEETTSKSALQKQHKEALGVQKKMQELVENKDSEIALLKARIATLEKINTSHDFQRPATRTRRRRYANENEAPKDKDLSTLSSSSSTTDSSFANKSTTSLTSKEEETKAEGMRSPLSIIDYIKCSSPVLAARTAIGNIKESMRTKSSAEGEHLTSAAAPPRKVRRKMYEKESCAPLECSPPPQEANTTESVHSIVTRKLRSRK